LEANPVGEESKCYLSLALGSFGLLLKCVKDGAEDEVIEGIKINKDEVLLCCVVFEIWSSLSGKIVAPRLAVVVAMTSLSIFGSSCNGLNDAAGTSTSILIPLTGR
jgi:hypothetical protein